MVLEAHPVRAISFINRLLPSHTFPIHTAISFALFEVIEGTYSGRVLREGMLEKRSRRSALAARMTTVNTPKEET